MPAAAGLSDDRRVALPSRPPTQMTRHRIAQIAEKVNPKSPESRPQEGRFLQNRLLHPPHSPAQCQPVILAVLHGRHQRCVANERPESAANAAFKGGRGVSRSPAPTVMVLVPAAIWALCSG